MTIYVNTRILVSMAPDYAIALSKLKALIDQHGSQVAAAEALGISLSYFNDLVHSRRAPSERLLEKLGLKLEVTEPDRPPTRKRRETR